MYYPTKRIVGANVDHDEKTKILTSYKDCLLKSCRERKKEYLQMKTTMKDFLLNGITFESAEELERVKPARGTVTENVVYYLCGYMIHKYRQHSCKECLSTINLDLDLLPEILTVEKLTLLKSRGWLKLASNNFFRLISIVEASLATFSLTDNILETNSFQYVLNSVIENDLPKVGCSVHSTSFVCNAIYDYLLLRFKAIARRKTEERVQELAARRHANRKLSKVSSLNK